LTRYRKLTQEIEALKVQKQAEYAEFEKSLAQNDDQVKKGDADTQQALQAIKVSMDNLGNV
jgi:hypothetical protein